METGMLFMLLVYKSKSSGMQLKLSREDFNLKWLVRGTMWSVRTP